MTLSLQERQEQLDSIIKLLNEVKTIQSKLIYLVNLQNKTLKTFNKRFDDISAKNSI